MFNDHPGPVAGRCRYSERVNIDFVSWDDAVLFSISCSALKMVTVCYSDTCLQLLKDNQLLKKGSD